MRHFTKFTFVLSSIFFSFSLIGQAGKTPMAPTNTGASIGSPNLFVPKNDLRTGNNRNPALFNPNLLQNRPALTAPAKVGTFRVVSSSDEGLPIFIEGALPSTLQSSNLDEACFQYITAVQNSMKIKDGNNEFQHKNLLTDPEGRSHYKMQQVFQGIPVYAGEVILHAKDGSIYALNGRYFPTPSLEDVAPSFDENAAKQIARLDFDPSGTITNFSDIELKALGQIPSPTLVVYHDELSAENELLAWHIIHVPSISERWEYFVNAKTGEVITKYNTVCKFHAGGNCSIHHQNNTEKKAPKTFGMPVVGPETGSGTDLKGINRSFNVWKEGTTYFMIDATRSMFNSAQSTFPDNPVGVIWTIDAQNIAPNASGNFSMVHITSNNNTWNSQVSVSAHYNAGKCYEYFKDTHSRNSINGSGGNVISIINVTEDGTGFDNAFWNGMAMFYGNGDVAFNAPLAKSLDVAGHEMSHGVIQNTANLVYQGQSGALNESFADAFGVLIDWGDYQLAEDIANPSIFPTGAMRDMANPNNGGNSLGDNGWQPAHMNEYQNLPNTPQGDNGGVHINSGIPNKAFHLFAVSVGKTKAEKVYYRALTNYLTANSQFVDCKIAVVQAAKDLYGANSAEATAATSAFNQVGITGNDGTVTQNDLPINDGQDFIIMTDQTNSQQYLFDGAAVPVLTTTAPMSKASVTDDGTVIVFVSEAGELKSLVLNPVTGNYVEDFIEQNPQNIWRNIVISRDGARIAALTNNFDNIIFVFDFDAGAGANFSLYNPTFTQGVTTGDVQYADIMEFDFTGEYVMYDAYNILDDDFGNAIDYWDIGFLKVWETGANDFADGTVEKLFSGLPENSSIGNPTFTKNSPYIIAFDFIENVGFNESYSLLGANIETGEVGTILQNTKLSYPNYSVLDDQMVFDWTDNTGAGELGIIGIGGDKISASGNAAGLIGGGRWGIWFAVGVRDLTNTQSVENNIGLTIAPNPFDENLNIQLERRLEQDANVEILDILGRLQHSEVIAAGTNQVSIEVSDLPSGTYILNIFNENTQSSTTLIKR